jgi:hypothetical protein
MARIISVLILFLRRAADRLQSARTPLRESATHDMRY